MDPWVVRGELDSQPDGLDHGHPYMAQMVRKSGVGSGDAEEGRQRAAKSGKWYSGATARQGAEQAGTARGA